MKELGHLSEKKFQEFGKNYNFPSLHVSSKFMLIS